MRIFKGTNKPYFEFNYAVGEPVELYIDGAWRIYEVCQHDDGEVYLAPYGFDLDLRWVSDLNKYKTRQTKATILKAKEILKTNIKERQDIIDNKREKDAIKQIQSLIKGLSKVTPKEPTNA